MLRLIACAILGFIVISVDMTYLQYMAVGALFAGAYLAFMAWILRVWFKDETL